MKHIFLVISFISSINILASELSAPRTCQTVSNIEQAKICAKSIFFTEHLETYYGSTLYLAYDKAQKEKVLKTLDAIESFPNERIAKNYKSLIESASYLAIVVDSNDMPYYSIYAMAKNTRTMAIMKNLSADWILTDDSFEDDNFDNYVKKLFAVSPNLILESYSY